MTDDNEGEMEGTRNRGRKKGKKETEDGRLEKISDRLRIVRKKGVEGENEGIKT